MRSRFSLSGLFCVAGSVVGVFALAFCAHRYLLQRRNDGSSVNTESYERLNVANRT